MSNDVLSQEEVDALLKGLTGENQSPETKEETTNEIRDYNLANQERIVRGRMPTMEIINERFARNMRLGLFNFTRKSPEVFSTGTKVQKFSAFLSELVVPNNLNIVSIKPLRGSGLVVCEPTLVFAIIDSLFGGNGKFHTRIEGRDFSQTELRVIQKLVEVIGIEFKKSWHGIYPLEIELQRSEMQQQFANIATPNEVVVSTSFKVDFGDASGAIHIAIPYATMEPIRDILYSTVQGDSTEPDKRWVMLLKNQIQDAEVKLVAELGKINTTIEEMLNMKKGDVFDLISEDKIQVKVDGVPTLSCFYGKNNGKYAIKVDKILTPLNKKQNINGEDL